MKKKYCKKCNSKKPLIDHMNYWWCSECGAGETKKGLPKVIPYKERHTHHHFLWKNE